MSSSSSSGAFVTGFLLGGLVGAAAVLLMTPESGEQTRIRLQERGIELRSRFDDLSAGLQERGKVVFDEMPASDTESGPETNGEEAPLTPSEAEDQEAAEESSD